MEKFDSDGNGEVSAEEKESVMALRPEQNSGERKDFGKRGGMRSFRK